MPKNKTLKDLPDEYEAGYLQRLDFRYQKARAINDSYCQMLSDAGGPSEMSYVQQSLAEHAVFIESLIRDSETLISQGKMSEVDLGSMTQLINCWSGLVTKFGLNRIPKNVSRLQEYITSKDSENSEAK